MAETSSSELDLLLAVSEQFRDDSRVHRIGPIAPDSEKKRLIVPLAVGSRSHFDDRELASFSTGDGERVEFIVSESPGASLFACPGETVPVAANPAPSTKMQGGHPIWHSSTSADWGTVAFTAKKIRVEDRAGHVIESNNAALTCNHVIALEDTAAPGDVVQNDVKSGALYDFLKITSAGGAPPMVDVALAQFRASDVTRQAKVEDIGLLAGVSELPGLRTSYAKAVIKKYGWRSKLTVGLDLGWVTLNYGAYDRQYVVRMASSGFACCHDSGSAIIDAGNSVVGILIAGEPYPCEARGFQFFIPCVAEGAADISTDPGVCVFWLSYQE